MTRCKVSFTVAEFGERIGVSCQTVYAVEIGKYDPSLPLAIRIAKTFS
ncbi:MAG: helix-turn-helix domain-containing protein [Terriglobia bacterium]|nr:helix-turn-helix domain-containing protein [Terriglobia bacterium]